MLVALEDLLVEYEANLADDNDLRDLELPLRLMFHVVMKAARRFHRPVWPKK